MQKNNKLILTAAAVLGLSATPALSVANDVERPFSVHIGLGKASMSRTIDIDSLTSKGYSVNSYTKDDVDNNSNSYGFSYAFSPKLNVEFSWLGLGLVESSIDLDLPENKSAEQAAKDVAEASPYQSGGHTIKIGGNFIQPVYSRLDLRLGAGAVIGSNRHEITINDEVFEFKDTFTEPYVTLGFGVKITRGFTVTAKAEHYFMDNVAERYEVGLSYSSK